LLSAEVLRRPDFCVIGAMKAGTTSLYLYLRRHPDVFMPARKELGFFVEEENWGRGLAWYAEQFRPAAAHQVCGEATTSYTKFPFLGGVPARMASVIPDAKLVYVLRHPVDRMVSEYVHHLATGHETKPIDDVIVQQSRYLMLSSYWLQLRQFLDCYPREQILVIRAEDLRSDRAATVRRVLDHIGVSSESPLPDLSDEANTAAERRAPRQVLARRHDWWDPAAPPPRSRVKRRLKRLATRPIDEREVRVSPQTREIMTDLIRPDIARLREYVGDDFDCWGIV
jgi:hypothetical protein